MIALRDDALAARPAVAHFTTSSSPRGARATRGGRRARSISTSCASIGRRSSDADLHVPHPELPNRDFWQRELAELRGGAMTTYTMASAGPS